MAGPGEMDLATALNMFKEGAQSLALSRAVNQANDQVQQIRASDMSEQQQRQQLQQLSNGLVMHMAAMGAPATTMQAVSGAIMPHFGNSAQMNQYGIETGDQGLQQEAAQQQSFEEAPEMERAKIMANAMAARMMVPLQEKEEEYNNNQLTKFSSDANMAKASSRSQFGQWAAVSNNGERLQQILGTPAQWNNLNAQQLALVTEGLTKQVTSGVPTESELKVLNPLLMKLKAAGAQTALTGKPTNVDLSGFAQLYSNLASREDMTAKSHLLDNMLAVNQGHAGLYNRVPEQWKQQAANNLQQLGITVNPEDINVDSKTGHVSYPPQLQGVIDASNNTPRLVRQAYADASSGDPTRASKATKLLQSFGITPGTAPTDAIRIIQAQIKSKAFQ